ncbi:3'-5' exonuclease [Streptomyces sp. NPDC015232]|uniref:3'-5' exonuclease n=1 Tax=unclassified Streptomyces TaxID=2593676 RepID=UPI0036FED76E
MTPGAGAVGDRANDYDATCARCGGPVPAGGGLLRHEAQGWRVYHPGHAPAPGPPPATDHPGWHRRPLLALDITTTGHRFAVDRITGAALRAGDGTERSWTVDPGPVPDPGPAAAPATTGAPDPPPPASPDVSPPATPAAPPERALDELAGLVADHLAAGELLVVWFAPYVLGTLHAELLRHGLPPLTARLPSGVAPVCDPLVLDRHTDRYRPGRRSLHAVAEWYGVPHATPGDPACDATAALALARAIPASYPSLARLSRPALHTEQVLWYAEQTARHPDAPAWPFEETCPLPWRPPPVQEGG